MSDRKYRHRGYQDDDRDHDDRRQQPRRPYDDHGKPRLEGAPRGRGVGLPAEAVFKCALCGHALKHATIAPETACASCGKPLHSCTNCSFFNTGARFECTKPLTARIESKSKANDCEHYQPKTIRDLKSKSSKAPQDARSAFDALFKK